MARRRGLGLAAGLSTLLWVAGTYLFAGHGELLAEDLKNLHEAAQFSRWQISSGSCGPPTTRLGYFERFICHLDCFFLVCLLRIDDC
jgi:hypothetical protein